jgi:hypothetical protein
MTEYARREQVLLRMAMLGVTGAGKTRGALEIATNLFDGSLEVGVIDTEHRRARLYADRYRFRHYDLLSDQSPEAWIAKMDELDRDGCEVQILDSVTHEWNGKNGVLSQADKFGDWKTVRPKHNAFVERILSSKAHVIVCIRAKMEYAVNEVPDTRPNRTGNRQVVEKLGLGPTQDSQFLYEFDVVADVDVTSHEATFSNRCDPLVGKTISLIPGTEVAGILTDWLSHGDPPEEASAEDVERLRELARAAGSSDEEIDAKFTTARSLTGGYLTPDYVERQIAALEARQQRQREPEPAPANA